MLAVALEHYIWNCSEEHEIFCVVVLFSRLSNKCLLSDGETFANLKLLSELKTQSLSTSTYQLFNTTFIEETLKYAEVETEEK